MIPRPRGPVNSEPGSRIRFGDLMHLRPLLGRQFGQQLQGYLLSAKRAVRSTGAAFFLGKIQETFPTAASIHVDDLDPQQRKQLGVPTPRQNDFSKEECRSWALKILASMAGLSRAERGRVLKHALKVNAV